MSQRILWNHVYVVIFEILNNHAEIIQAPLFRDEMQVNVSGFLPQLHCLLGGDQTTLEKP